MPVQGQAYIFTEEFAFGVSRGLPVPRALKWLKLITFTIGNDLQDTI